MRFKIYLSGPMAGIENNNHPLFYSETKRLRSLEIDIENPAENDMTGCTEWADFMRIDICQLMKCQAIAMLPNWYNSKGANLEYQIAKSLGMIICNASDLVEGNISIALGFR